MLAGFTHAPVIELSEALVRLLPRRASRRCFYADNGSSAIEVARQDELSLLAEPRPPEEAPLRDALRQLSRRDARRARCHRRRALQEVYAPLLMDGSRVPSPDAAGASRARAGRRQPAHVRRDGAHLAAHADEIAAVIVEPLVQGAGRCACTTRSTCALREACDRYGVLLIADEIAIGFGRTGTLFACEQAGHPPGLPVPVEGPHRRLPAAVGRADHRRSTRAFYDDDASRGFLHSHSLHRQSRSPARRRSRRSTSSATTT